MLCITSARSRRVPLRHLRALPWQVRLAAGAPHGPTAVGAPVGGNLATVTPALAERSAGALPRNAAEVAAYFAGHGSAADMKQFHLNRCGSGGLMPRTSRFPGCTWRLRAFHG